MTSPEPASGEDGESGDGPEYGLVQVCLIAAFSAVAVGVVGGAFRWGLERAAEWRVELIDWTRDTPGPVWLVPIVITSGAAALARLMVDLAPEASGSGIQDVEAVWDQQLPSPRLRVLPARFVGGLLALGSGLVLGREGPTVHMGSVIGAEAARRLRVPPIDARVLQASLAGAGLAVAFNAPIGGALFVFEEVTRSFRPRLVMTTLIGCAIAVSCSRLILGNRPDFVVATPETPPLTQLWVFVVFGLAVGLVGALYNSAVMAGLRITDSITRVGPVPKAALIGAVIGAALVVDPLSVGGGEALSQELLAGEHLLVPALLGYLFVRLLVGPMSYAAGAPGGLFAPLLAVGALCGALATPLVEAVMPSFGHRGVPLVTVGMAALFAAVVRAPFTGIVLIIEMTAVTTLTVPMLAACFGATLTATLVGSAPIYDSLKERTLALRQLR